MKRLLVIMLALFVLTTGAAGALVIRPGWLPQIQAQLEGEWTPYGERNPRSLYHREVFCIANPEGGLSCDWDNTRRVLNRRR